MRTGRVSLCARSEPRAQPPFFNPPDRPSTTKPPPLEGCSMRPGAFNCGHPLVPANTITAYGETRCRECKNAASRRYAARRRARFIADHGRYDAIPDAA